MGIEIERTTAELEDQDNLAYEEIEKGGSRWPGMSYEQGVSATIRWIQGDEETGPMNGDD